MSEIDPDISIAATLSQPVSAAVVTPDKLIRLYSDDEWETFVNEWADGFVPKYDHFDRLGGAGDKGRDIVGYAGADKTVCPIDIFQCKHYDHPLYPGDIWTELGKLCVYTSLGHYRVPRLYRFVAPQGVGTTLADLLAKPDMLRAELIKNWATKCETLISKTQSFPLKDQLLKYVHDFDFSIVGYVPVLKILEQHRRTPYWHHRFKRDYPARPAVGQPPVEVQNIELPYVSQLFAAYGQHVSITIKNASDLVAHSQLQHHFSRSRVDFYMADGLNRFYRDQFTQGAFDDIKGQIFDGVIDVANLSYANGYHRIVATTQQAVSTQLSQTDYVPYVQPGDRKGICHHLVNDDKLTWVTE